MNRFVAFFLVLVVLGGAITAAVLLMGNMTAGGYRVASKDAPETLDPHMMSGVKEAYLGEAVFEGLLVSRPDGTIAPGVAESWEMSDDGKVYTFKLRDDAFWVGPDGNKVRPVTAQDFDKSWRRAIDPRTASPYTEVFAPIKNAENVWKSKGLIEFLTSDDARAAKGEGAARNLSARDFLIAVACTTGFSEANWQAQEAAVDEAGVTRAVVEIKAHEAVRNGLCTGFEYVDANKKLILQGVPADDILTKLLEPGIKVLDARTLEVTLRAVTPYFPDLVAFHTYLPVNFDACLDLFENEKQKGTYDPAWFKHENIVTNGPFRLTKWDPDREMVFTRNEHYWNLEAIALDKVVVITYTEESAMLADYKADKIDIVDVFSPAQATQLMKEQPSDFYVRPYFGTYYYRLNLTKPPFNDPEKGALVRRALSLAIDRATVCATLPEQPTPTAGFVAPGVPNYPDFTGLAFDVERAKALLAEAGYPDGRDLPPIELLYNTSEQHKATATLVQSELQTNLGVKIELKNQEWKTYLATTRNLNYTMQRAGWIGDYIDPATFIDMFVTGGGNNNTGFSNVLYDTIVFKYTQDIFTTLDTPATRQRVLDDISAYKARATAASGWLETDEQRNALLQTLDTLRNRVTEWDPGADKAAREAAARDIRFGLFSWAEHILCVEHCAIIPIYHYKEKRLIKPWVKGHNMDYIRLHTAWRYLSLQKGSTASTTANNGSGNEGNGSESEPINAEANTNNG